MNGVIDDFRGEYRWLSNFEMCSVVFEGWCFPSSEHAYHAAKCEFIHLRSMFTIGTCREAKDKGKTIPLRPGWDVMKLWVMETVLRDKFTRNPLLGKKLILTGNARLVEGNTWGDVYWGVCQGSGENHLGRLLMQIRADLQEIVE